jgi:hypothetical protein
MKPQVEKSEMMFLFQVMPHNSPTLCAEGGERERNRANLEMELEELAWKAWERRRNEREKM